MQVWAGMQMMSGYTQLILVIHLAYLIHPLITKINKIGFTIKFDCQLFFQWSQRAIEIDIKSEVIFLSIFSGNCRWSTL